VLNNKVRVTTLNLPPLAAVTILVIHMIGTNPIFYNITVTAELSTAVQQGTYPAQKHVFSIYPCASKMP
jgi:hypothetical protein